MILNEFIKEIDKNQMIKELLQYYKVESVKWKYKSMKDYAHFDVDKGVLELSSRYKKLKDSQVKDFLITMIHEIRHAMDSKKYGWNKFKEMWEYEANMIAQGHVKGKTEPYGDNPYEIEAEEFGQKNWKQWYSKFKKQNLI
tara:strand:- start:285 stop:707 length:423 start_codon:yes stop_codon:yes gene_type:complete